ncbi:MAG: ArnT family glycosyltransferase [Ignavibacteriaceae bacterium]
MRRTQKIIFFILIFMWISLRINGLYDSHNEEWERNVAVKLNEYGWQATSGGILEWHYMFGHINNPRDHLYINHPPGMIWAYSLFIKVFGENYLRLIPFLFNLFAALLIYSLTKKYFDTRTALFALGIITFIPGALFFDLSINTIILTLVFWVFILYITLEWFNTGSKKYYYYFFFLILIGSQIDWVIFLLFPFILAGIFFFIIREKRRKYFLFVILTFFSAGLIFLLQIIYYVPNVKHLISYLILQTTSGSIENHQLGFIQIQKKIFTKLVLYGSPIILVFACVGSYLVIKSKNKIHLYILLVLGGPILLLFIFFNRFIFIEVPPFKLVAPFLSVSGAVAINYFLSKKRKWVSYSIYILLFIFLIVSVITVQLLNERTLTVSNIPAKLASIIKENSSPRTVILTNLVEKKFPFADWDNGSWVFTSYLSDRYIRFDADSEQVLLRDMKDVKIDSALYILTPEQYYDKKLFYNSRKLKFTKIKELNINVIDDIKISKTLEFMEKMVIKLDLPSNKLFVDNKRKVNFNLLFYKVKENKNEIN